MNPIEEMTRDMKQEAYTTTSVDCVANMLVQYQKAKDAGYKRAWADKGLLGWWAGGIAPPMARIDPLMRKLIANNRDGTQVGVSLFDALADIACYAMMGICLLARLFPKTWQKFLKRMDTEIS